jgi:hypothetical protein
MWDNMKSNIGVIVSFFFALLALLYSINADIIAQDDTFFLWVPYKSLRDRCDEVPLKKITRHAEQQRSQLTYIFVLDKSRSLNYSGSVPEWYNMDLIDDLNSYLNRDGGGFRYFRRPAPFELCRIKLAQLLVELHEDNQSGTKFEIWVIGDQAVEEYPDNNEPKTGIQRIRYLLDKLLDVRGHTNMNTDFTNFFSSILKKHDKFIEESRSDKFAAPPFIFIIFSDFVHDLENRLLEESAFRNDRQREEYYKKNEKKLKNDIIKVAESNSIANMIMMKNPEPEVLNRIIGNSRYKTYLGDVLKEKMISSRVDTGTISEGGKDALYANIFTEPAVKIYYRNPVHVRSSTIIKINEPGAYKFKLTWESLKLYDQIFSMAYEVFDPNGFPKKVNGKSIKGVLFINSDNHKKIENLDFNCNIKLTYSGLPYENGNFPHFKIRYPKEKKVAFTIPFNFIKMLPVEIAYLMFILQICLLISTLIWVWLRILVPWMNSDLMNPDEMDAV